MKNKTYVINGAEYTKKQLLEIGRENNPGIFWVPRILGIQIALGNLFIMALIGVALLVLHLTGVLKESDFPIWAFFIPLGVFGLIFLIGVLCIILSFNSERKTIKYATSYLSKQENNGERVLSKHDEEVLQRNDRLFKNKIISEEEYNAKKEEILGKK